MPCADVTYHLLRSSLAFYHFAALQLASDFTEGIEQLSISPDDVCVHTCVVTSPCDNGAGKTRLSAVTARTHICVVSALATGLTQTTVQFPSFVSSLCAAVHAHRRIFSVGCCKLKALLLLRSCKWIYCQKCHKHITGPLVDFEDECELLL